MSATLFLIVHLGAYAPVVPSTINEGEQRWCKSQICCMKCHNMILIVDYIVIGILNSKPELNQLMNKIAVVIPDKWEDFGYELGIGRRDMQRIKCESYNTTNSTRTAYRELFSHWLSHAVVNGQCTWTAVLDALAAEQVGEETLAREIRQDLLQKGLKQ